MEPTPKNENPDPQSSLVLYAANEPTTLANHDLIDHYMDQWGSDFGFFCGQVVALVICSLQTDDLRELLAEADKNAANYFPSLVAARQFAPLGVC